MSNTLLTGNVTFVNHEKKYIIIEYEENGRKKVVNGSVDEKQQQKLIDRKLIKKKHLFHIGDTVNFTAGLSDRGDRMTASFREQRGVGLRQQTPGVIPILRVAAPSRVFPIRARAGAGVGNGIAPCHAPSWKYF